MKYLSWYFNINSLSNLWILWVVKNYLQLVWILFYICYFLFILSRLPQKLDLQGIVRKHRLNKERSKVLKENFSTKGVNEDSEDEAIEASGWDQYED